MRLSSISLNNLKTPQGQGAAADHGPRGRRRHGGEHAVPSPPPCRADTERKIDQFGANILIVPRSDDLALSYGGVAVGASTHRRS